MHIFANPARFLRLARPLTAWLGWGGALLIADVLDAPELDDPTLGDVRELTDEAADALLAEVGQHIAHYPIRTRGTFCGSIANTDPASEWCLVAATLGATMIARSTRGERELSEPGTFPTPTGTFITRASCSPAVAGLVRSPVTL